MQVDTEDEPFYPAQGVERSMATKYDSKRRRSLYKSERNKKCYVEQRAVAINPPTSPHEDARCTQSRDYLQRVKLNGTKN